MNIRCFCQAIIFTPLPLPLLDNTNTYVLPRYYECDIYDLTTIVREHPRLRLPLRLVAVHQTQFVVVRQEHLATIGEQTCSICCEIYRAGDLIRHLPCSHFFHINCVNNWIRNNDTCPSCRHNFARYFNQNVINVILRQVLRHAEEHHGFRLTVRNVEDLSEEGYRNYLMTAIDHISDEHERFYQLNSYRNFTADENREFDLKRLERTRLNIVRFIGLLDEDQTLRSRSASLERDISNYRRLAEPVRLEAAGLLTEYFYEFYNMMQPILTNLLFSNLDYVYSMHRRLFEHQYDDDDENIERIEQERNEQDHIERERIEREHFQEVNDMVYLMMRFLKRLDELRRFFNNIHFSVSYDFDSLDYWFLRTDRNTLHPPQHNESNYQRNFGSTFLNLPFISHMLGEHPYYETWLERYRNAQVIPLIEDSPEERTNLALPPDAIRTYFYERDLRITFGNNMRRRVELIVTPNVEIENENNEKSTIKEDRPTWSGSVQQSQALEETSTASQILNTENTTAFDDERPTSSRYVQQSQVRDATSGARQISNTENTTALDDDRPTSSCYVQQSQVLDLTGRSSQISNTENITAFDDARPTSSRYAQHSQLNVASTSSQISITALDDERPTCSRFVQVIQTSSLPSQVLNTQIDLQTSISTRARSQTRKDAHQSRQLLEYSTSRRRRIVHEEIGSPRHLPASRPRIESPQWFETWFDVNRNEDANQSRMLLVNTPVLDESENMQVCQDRNYDFLIDEFSESQLSQLSLHTETEREISTHDEMRHETNASNGSLPVTLQATNTSECSNGQSVEIPAVTSKPTSRHMNIGNGAEPTISNLPTIPQAQDNEITQNGNQNILENVDNGNRNTDSTTKNGFVDSAMQSTSPISSKSLSLSGSPDDDNTNNQAQSLEDDTLSIISSSPLPEDSDFTMSSNSKSDEKSATPSLSPEMQSENTLPLENEEPTVPLETQYEQRYSHQEQSTLPRLYRFQTSDYTHTNVKEEPTTSAAAEQYRRQEESWLSARRRTETRAALRERRETTETENHFAMISGETQRERIQRQWYRHRQQRSRSHSRLRSRSNIRRVQSRDRYDRSRSNRRSASLHRHTRSRSYVRRIESTERHSRSRSNTRRSESTDRHDRSRSNVRRSESRGRHVCLRCNTSSSVSTDRHDRSHSNTSISESTDTHNCSRCNTTKTESTDSHNRSRSSTSRSESSDRHDRSRSSTTRSESTDRHDRSRSNVRRSESRGRHDRSRSNARRSRDRYNRWRSNRRRSESTDRHERSRSTLRRSTSRGRHDRYRGRTEHQATTTAEAQRQRQRHLRHEEYRHRRRLTEDPPSSESRSDSGSRRQHVSRWHGRNVCFSIVSRNQSRHSPSNNSRKQQPKK